MKLKNKRYVITISYGDYRKGSGGTDKVILAHKELFLENNKDERFKFVNREQDVGDIGLRKAKLSYNPIGYIEKYNGFCLKNN